MTYDFTDSRPIPCCADCGAALGDYGRCEDCDDRAEQPTSTRDTLGYCTGCGAPPEEPCMCSATIKAITETPRHTIFCVCSAAGVILTPEGTLCGACYEAQSLWQLWKTDSTAFVWMLRQQRPRLNEMAARLATYLSRKHGAHLSCDSVLAMWRQLLDDGEPPEPRFYVVATRRAAA